LTVPEATVAFPFPSHTSAQAARSHRGTGAAAHSVAPTTDRSEEDRQPARR
jgi:hypothetical protein